MEMLLGGRIQNYLIDHGVAYQQIGCPARDTLYEAAQAALLPPGKVLRASLVESSVGLLMAILPCDRILDVEALSARLGCDIWPATEVALTRHFPDCDARFIPGLPQAYEIPAIVDDSIASLDRFWLASGASATLLEFESLVEGIIWRDAWHGNFARRRAALIRDDLDGDGQEQARQPHWPSAVQLKHRIDEIYTQLPYYGSRKIAAQLQREGMGINRKTVAGYMQEMGIAAVYPGPNLSKRNQKEGVYPYLLQHITSAYPNHIWGIDITYIRLRGGWMYLVADAGLVFTLCHELGT